MNFLIVFFVFISPFACLADYAEEVQKIYFEKINSSSGLKCSSYLPLNDSLLKGKENIKVVISKTGVVEDFQYKSDNDVSIKYGNCLKKLLLKSKFPKPRKDKYIFETYHDWDNPATVIDDVDIIPEKFKKIVKQKFLEQNGFLSPCYSNYLKNGGNREGKITFKWEINGDGKVSNVQFIQDELTDPTLASCLQTGLLKMDFSNISENATVLIRSYPVVFKK